MSRGRIWFRYAVYLAPLVCVAVATLALLWISGIPGSPGDAAEAETAADAETDAEDAELSETVADLVETLTDATGADASSETFLEELSELAAEELDGATPEPVVVTWEEQTDLVSLASGVLESYEEVAGASLATSGYLDLQGNSWGAVVRGGSSWVDIVLVSTEDDEVSTARIVRLLPGDVDGDA